jgi:spore photoproduct lyase
MYRSANYLLFVNFEDFANDLREHVKNTTAKNPWYFSGYDCDSLALEPITGFADYFLKVFSEKCMQKATLELRTKSTQIRSLLSREALPNVVVAFSLNPDEVIASVEAGTPKLEKRLKAIQQLQSSGWRVGLRFDPVVWHEGFEENYQRFFKHVFSVVNTDLVDSITLGSVRLPKGFHKIMSKLYPEHWLFKSGVELDEKGMVTYNQVISEELLGYCQDEIKRYISAKKVFIYN